MKKIALLTLGFLLVCNCAFAVATPVALSPLPTNTDATWSKGYGLLSNGVEYLATVSQASGNLIDHKFIFELSGSDIYGSAQSFDFSFGVTKVSWIDNFTATLFNRDGDDLGSLSEIKSLIIPSLPAAEYYIAITGEVTGLTGTYSFGISPVQPVPVPAAALLLGAGLLGIVGIRRRQVA